MDNAKIWKRINDWTSTNWQGPGPRYFENMPQKIVVRKKKSKSKPKEDKHRRRARVRSRSRSPSKGDRRDLGSEATLAYISMVKHTFAEYPEVYNAFVRILSEIKDPSANVIEIIEKVILLFDGYPDLIFSFNAFLPHKYEIEIQDDAVVIRVCDTEEHEGLLETGTPTLEFTESIAYIREVKKTYVHTPRTFGKFMAILDKFHSKKLDEIGAIHEVVKLFKGHPHLILGFNEFLPDACKIHMFEKSKFMISHVGRDGNQQSTAVEI